MIEGNRDSITSFVNEDITELGDYIFKDCVNLEYVYLPNCTKLGKDCFQSGFIPTQRKIDSFMNTRN